MNWVNPLFILRIKYCLRALTTAYGQAFELHHWRGDRMILILNGLGRGAPNGFSGCSVFAIPR